MTKRNFYKLYRDEQARVERLKSFNHEMLFKHKIAVSALIISVFINFMFAIFSFGG